MKKAIPKIALLATLTIALIIAGSAFLLESTFAILGVSFGLRLAFWLLGAILIGILITTGFLALSPGFFNALTVLKKITRFENLSHPLLLRLAYEAPGTFHHSINVSILGQKAAKSIGADSLLVRVAAYYHDIGKLDSPHTFIENQSGEDIPCEEDEDYIRRTAKKIISHIECGQKLAAEYHLPSEITDLISEHHGTTKVLYFFEKAKERGLKIKRTDFHYQGPVPQSKEAAILMLADSIEAATRAIPNLTFSEMEKIITDAFRDKILEKQLINSSIKENEMALIKRAFLETLGAIYHQRVVKKNE